jgi:hypothetical protein
METVPETPDRNEPGRCSVCGDVVMFDSCFMEFIDSKGKQEPTEEIVDEA